MMATALAPTGAMFTFLSLWTGALWGKPMWGTWWVWDASLTSELILFFLYMAFIALQSAVEEPRRADKAGAVLEIGRASCRERVCQYVSISVVPVSVTKKTTSK